MPLREVRRAKERDRTPRTPHAAGTADAMREEFVGLWKLVVDHAVDVQHVQPTCGNIRGD
jgi:hypothetical protein